MSKVIPENSTPLENSSGQNEVKRSLKAEFTDSVDSVQIYPPLHDESMESRMHPGIEGEWEDDSMLKDLLSMVDMGEWRQQRNIDQQQKENKRYQSVSGKKERLIERFSQEKIKTPSEDKQNERKRNKSITVITDRFCNTKRSKHFIREEQINHDLCKRTSEISTTDCRSGDQKSSKRASSQKYRKMNHFNPYEESSFLERAHKCDNMFNMQCKRDNSSDNCKQSNFRQRSTCARCYLGEIGDTTPQKVCIVKKPQTPATDTNSYGLKMTPAKSKESGEKIDLFMSPNIIIKQTTTPKMVISNKKLSASRERKSDNAPPKLKIKKKDSTKKSIVDVPHLDEIMNNFGIGKAKRITQTEKKARPQENPQLKKYEPLCSSSNKSKYQKSAMKEVKIKDYIKEFTEWDQKYLVEPNLNIYDTPEEILVENEYYFDPAEGDVRQEITFGDIKNHTDPNSNFDRLMHKENRPNNLASENYHQSFDII